MLGPEARTPRICSVARLPVERPACAFFPYSGSSVGALSRHRNGVTLDPAPLRHDLADSNVLRSCGLNGLLFHEVYRSSFELRDGP